MQTEKYINVTPERLIEDEFFLDWVLRKNPEAEAFWKELMRNEPNEQKAILQAKEFVQSLHRILSEESINEFNTHELWDRIQTQTSTKIRSFTPRKWIAAAGILLILSIIFLFPKGSKTIQTQWGEVAQIELPDASKVIINSTSQISYSTRKWGKDRTVNLTGEAFFEVTPGQKFTVATPQGSIVVLGTSFNVRARDSITLVDCLSGKVAVIDHNGNSETIYPGQKIIINSSGLSDAKEGNNQEHILSWRTGVVYLPQATLQTAIQELQWYFPVEIQVDETLLSRPLEGFFKTSNLDSALYQITTPLNLEYKTLTKEVILIKEK